MLVQGGVNRLSETWSSFFTRLGFLSSGSIPTPVEFVNLSLGTLTLGILALHDRVLDAGLEDRALGVVDDEPSRESAGPNNEKEGQLRCSLRSLRSCACFA